MNARVELEGFCNHVFPDLDGDDQKEWLQPLIRTVLGELRAAEARMAAVETWFKEGCCAAEAGQPSLSCPSSGDEREHWWTRGYAYTARLHRAIAAETRIAKLEAVASAARDLADECRIMPEAYPETVLRVRVALAALDEGKPSDAE